MDIKEKENIIEFVRNIRNDSAKPALENLKQIVSIKQKQRQQQILTDLEEC